MSEPSSADAPAGQEAQDIPETPTFEELAADPEIAALLDFAPVPRQRKRRGGWTAPLQKRFIAELTKSGSPTLAADALGKKLFSAKRLYQTAGAESFRAAWDGAVALFEERSAAEAHAAYAGLAGLKPPLVDRRRRPAQVNGPPPGQLLNERGQWEDEASFHRRGEEAKDSINAKLRRARRLFLRDISDDPAKRAAFEILTRLPVDWDKAEQCLPQDDEPWRNPRMVEPQMLLTAEAGWVGGDILFGPDKKAELLAEINEWRAKRGLPPVCWKDDDRAGEEIPDGQW